MNKLLVFTALAMFAVSISVAQDKPAPQRRFGENNGPLLRQLNLTDQQRKDIEKLRFDMQKKAVDQRAKMQTARLELRELFKADSPDQSAIQKKVAELSQLQTQQRAMRIDHWFSVNKLLTPDQQKIWKRISARLLMQQRARMARGHAAQSRRNMGNQMRMRRPFGGPMRPQGNQGNQ